MASGVNGNWEGDQLQSSTVPNFTEPDEFEMNNTLLLLIIIALCALMVLMLFFVFLCVCFKSSKNANKHHNRDLPVRIVLVSKSTSITGLCENANNNVKNDKVRIIAKCYTDKKLNCTTEQVFHKSSQPKLMTSTPGGKLDECELSYSKNLQSGKVETSIQCNNMSKGTCGTSNSSSEEHCLLSQPESLSNWASVSLSPNTDSSLYATANSFKLGSLHTAENLAQYLVDDLKSQNEKESDITLNSEFSPLSSAKISKSMPLDSYGHPRAWFVPLDKVYHEPIRHSYIEMPKQPLLSLDGKSEDCVKQPKNSGLMLNLPSSNSNENGFDAFHEQGSESDMSWRDSGVPQSSLGRYNSSDFEKKPSVWEQREDRPVVFLENPDHASICTRSND